MRFVTLNLGIGDAAVLRRAVEGTLGACSCREESGHAPCSECAALEPIRDDLHRFLAPVADRSLGSRRDDALFAGRDPLPQRGLWIVPPATVDA